MSMHGDENADVMLAVLKLMRYSVDSEVVGRRTCARGSVLSVV